MVGKSATVSLIGGVAECDNTFLRHSFLHFSDHSRSKKSVGLRFLRGEGLEMEFGDSLKLDFV